MVLHCRAIAGKAPALRLHSCSLRAGTKPARKSLQCGCSISCDVLLVDAQNVLSRAHADHRRGCRRAGETAAGSFADWLRFLTAVAEPQLLVAVFDAPAARRQGQQQRQALAPEYLQRRRRRQEQQQQQQGRAGSSGSDGSVAPSAAAPSGGDPLRPYKQQAAELGGICLEAAGGWEADDGLAAACVAVQQSQPGARVLVASGDGDMQQLLAPQVAWLRLHNQASLACPLGLDLVTAAAFQQQHSFPASAYADWLALVGKREASIHGAGVGGRSAAKLLARYGNLDAVLAAAEAGELKGWGPSVACLLAGSSGGSSGEGEGWQHRRAQLHRNRQVFGVRADPAVVDPRGMKQLLAALERLRPAAAAAKAVMETSGVSSIGWGGSSSSSSSIDGSGSSSGTGGSQSAIAATAQLAWQHPLHARRRRHLQQLAGSSGTPVVHQQAATPQGLAVDELLESATSGIDQSSGSGGSSTGSDNHSNNSNGSSSSGNRSHSRSISSGAARPRATFLVCPCDVPAGSWPRVVAAVQGCPPGQDCTALLLPLLHGAMQHHVKLVKRAGCQLRLQLVSTEVEAGLLTGQA